MRTSIVRLAESISKHPINVAEAGSALFPPIPLYRRVLRAHRALPKEMRSLGDDYVKAEFRRHKTTDNPVYVMGFLAEWKFYLDELSKYDKTTASSFRGKALDRTMLESMSEEQLGQLYELMHASKDVWKTPNELEGASDAPDGSDADKQTS